MKILEQALKKIKLINKKQHVFFMILIQGLIGSVGKKTFRNLSRYTQLAEHTFLRQMAKVFDFVGVNMAMLESIKSDDSVLMAAQDTTFMSKAGKKTSGLGYFWNGSAGKADRGLEFDVIAIIKLNQDKKEGYALSAEQTPANQLPKSERKKIKKGDETRIDFYLRHLKHVASNILNLGVKFMVADAFFAKNKYINGVVALGLHVISKLRKDARLSRIYEGPQKARGRKKMIDNGKIKDEDFKDSTVVKVSDESTELQSCVAYSISLKRKIKVVRLRKAISKHSYQEAFLFSTDTNADMLMIYQFYQARFQIEFIFRDAKGSTGLADCQSRDARRQHFHVNASLAALNIIKIQDNAVQQKNKTQHAFSIVNWARKYHVEIVINRFIAMFKLDQTLIKSHPDYENILEFSNVKH